MARNLRLERPTNEVVCPVCLNRFDWPNAAVVASNDAVTLDPDLTVHKIKAMDRKNQATEISAIYRAGPQALCGSEERHKLPISYNDDPPIRIAIVGPSGSSKSTYLASLIHTLMEGPRTGISLTAQQGGNHTTLRDGHIAPIFTGTDRKVLALTGREQHRTPFIYRLEVAGNQGRRYTLVFADVAGEMVSDQDRALELSYLAAADGVILLVDPEQVRSVTSLLRMKAEEGRWNPIDPIENLVRNTELFSVAPRIGNRLLMPLSVVIAKADVVADMPSFRRAGSTLGSAWLQDDRAALSNGATALLDRFQLAEETKEVAGFLLYHNQRPLMERIESSFWTFTGHLASATNSGTETINPADWPQPDASVVGDARIDTTKRWVSPPEPRRVLNPLLSILDRLGVLGDEQAHGEHLLPLPPERSR